MPNALAYIALFSWPLIVFIILKRYPVNVGIFISITAAFLLLPAGLEIDPPLLPPLDKVSISSISLLICLILLRKKFKLFQPGSILNVFLVYLIVIVFSVFFNGDPVIIGGKFLPGLTPYDALSELIRALLRIVPFFLGRYFFTDIKDNENILKILVIFALFYSIPMLYEIRMSPQLHNIAYGYYATDFIQSMRGSGFRASVLVGHGLPLAFWVSIAALAAMALHKNKTKILKFPAITTILFLMFVLILSKTWGALFNVMLGAVFVYLLSPRKQVKLALVFASLVMLYPVSKIVGVFPDKEIIQTISEYNVERADSMKTRYINEERLLTHALEKPIFGWSGYGRNRIFDELGKDITITDGMWILQMSIYGSIGFLFYYILLLTPLYSATKYLKDIESPSDKVYFSLLSLMLALCIIDSVPNTNMGTMNWLLAGALMGQCENLKKQRLHKIKENISQTWLKNTS
jgi:hypothetical protein